MGLMLGALLVPASARGDEPAPPADRATLLVREANRHYELGHFREALQRYEAAYALRPEPKWLFNMAQAQRELRAYAEAIRLYELYLLKVPDSPLRTDVESLIERSRQQLHAETERRRLLPSATGAPPAPAAAPPATTTPSAGAAPPDERTRSHPWYTRWWVWTAVGVVATGAVVGGVLGTRNHNPEIPATAHGTGYYFGAQP
jgi:tetratricopeptide (TPR) repeat protein